MPLTLHPHRRFCLWLGIFTRTLQFMILWCFEPSSFRLYEKIIMKIIGTQNKDTSADNSKFWHSFSFQHWDSKCKRTDRRNCSNSLPLFSTLIIRIGFCLLLLRSRLNNAFHLLKHRIYFGECIYKSNMYAATAFFSSRSYCISRFLIISSAILSRLLSLIITLSCSIAIFFKERRMLDKAFILCHSFLHHASYKAWKAYALVYFMLPLIFNISILLCLYHCTWTIWPSMFASLSSFTLNSIG